MAREISLEQLHIPTPCSARWDAMAGGDRRRFCATCQKHVIDLSAHTRAEAEAIVNAALPGGLCAQFSVDAAGRVVTRDATRRRAWWRAGIVASTLLTLVATMVGCRRPPEARERTVVGAPRPYAKTQAVTRPGEVRLMGDVCPVPMTLPATTLPATQSVRGEATTRPTP